MGKSQMKLHLFSALCVLTCAIWANAQDTSSLRFVHVVWRHGDRSPADPTFPKDVDNMEWTWPQGWGQLTQQGMKQHYDLGKILRKRYVDSGFLLEHYNATQIYIRSSDYNRTIMSAQSNMAGMYPPLENEKFLANLAWSPIPVHVVPKDNDPVIWMDHECPKAHDIYFNDVLKSSAAKEVEEENAQLLTFLREQTGHPISTLDDVRYIYDPLNCERIHNATHKWPAWMNNSLFTRIEELHRVSKTFSYHDPRVRRFRGSLLFREIAQRSEWKAKNESSLLPSTVKYYVYSAHDSTMIALFENLGAYNAMGAQVPPYAAAVMFELHERDGTYFIQVWYLNETGTEKPVPVPVEGCQPVGECTLDHFVQMARERTPSDWYAECGYPELVDRAKYKRVSVAAEVLGATTALLLILLLIAVAQLMRRSGTRGFYA